MRKMISYLLVVAIMLSSLPLTVHAENYNAPRLYIWNTELEVYQLYTFSGSQPIVRNSRMLVPLKSGVFGRLGGSVSYDPINKEITMKTKQHVIATYLQELDIYNKGIRCYIADVRSDYVSGEVYVQLKAFVESIGYTLEYDQRGYAAYIRKY